MEEEGEKKMKELKAKHEQQLADLREAQEVEKERAETAWKFKMEMEETKIQGREAGLDRQFKERKEKLEEEWVEKRVCRLSIAVMGCRTDELCRSSWS